VQYLCILNITSFQPLIKIHILLVLATFARRLGGNEDLQTVVVTNSLAIESLCEQGNISVAELLQNECEEIISSLGDECRAINKHTFSLAKSQLFLCKGLVSFCTNFLLCLNSMDRYPA
jgi:hypothetical protein